jgi:hypothetical protein
LRGSFLVLYAVEFLCLSAAQLLVLERYLDFGAPEIGSSRRLRWFRLGRITLVLVVVGNSVGFFGNIAAAVCFQKASETLLKSASFYAAGNRQDGDDVFSKASSEIQLGVSATSIQQFSEVVVMFLILVSFIVCGILCVRVVASRLLAVDSESTLAAQGRRLQLRIAITAGFLFVTCLLRTGLAVMRAFTYELQNAGDINCAAKGKVITNRCDPVCFNMYTHIMWWMDRTPEFQTIIVLLSSPLSMIVALWGMTTGLALQLMKSRKRNNWMSPHRIGK